MIFLIKIRIFLIKIKINIKPPLDIYTTSNTIWPHLFLTCMTRKFLFKSLIIAYTLRYWHGSAPWYRTPFCQLFPRPVDCAPWNEPKRRYWIGAPRKRWMESSIGYFGRRQQSLLVHWAFSTSRSDGHRLHSQSSTKGSAFVRNLIIYVKSSGWRVLANSSADSSYTAESLISMYLGSSKKHRNWRSVRFCFFRSATRHCFSVGSTSFNFAVKSIQILTASERLLLELCILSIATEIGL